MVRLLAPAHDVQARGDDNECLTTLNKVPLYGKDEQPVRGVDDVLGQEQLRREVLDELLAVLDGNLRPRQSAQRRTTQSPHRCKKHWYSG